MGLPPVPNPSSPHFTTTTHLTVQHEIHTMASPSTTENDLAHTVGFVARVSTLPCKFENLHSLTPRFHGGVIIRIDHAFSASGRHCTELHVDLECLQQVKFCPNDGYAQFIMGHFPPHYTPGETDETNVSSSCLFDGPHLDANCMLYVS